MFWYKTGWFVAFTQNQWSCFEKSHLQTTKDHVRALSVSYICLVRICYRLSSQTEDRFHHKTNELFHWFHRQTTKFGSETYPPLVNNYKEEEFSLLTRELMCNVSSLIHSYAQRRKSFQVASVSFQSLAWTLPVLAVVLPRQIFCHTPAACVICARITPRRAGLMN